MTDGDPSDTSTSDPSTGATGATDPNGPRRAGDAVGPAAAPAAVDGPEAAPGRRGERRLIPSLTILVLIALPFTLPTSQQYAPWILVIGGVPLLVAVLIADPGRIDRRGRVLRVLSRSIIVLLACSAAFATVRLIVELLEGAPQLQTAAQLLRAGFVVWIDVNLTFALLYWELDGGGAATRLLAPHPYPDLAFPQHMAPELAPPGWMPTFLDYLYLGLTNALAFSPTDVMPLRHWAKLTMALQSLLSVAILSLVIANAVNVIGSG
ncbi:MAG: hypothetical protein U0Q07_20375 [Acidimicrobiales bacterium]